MELSLVLDTSPSQSDLTAVDNDPCDKNTGCFLLQNQPDSTDRPTGYWSPSLDDAEWEYGTTHWERLAVVFAVLLLCLYFESFRHTVRPDQNIWIVFELEKPDCNLLRWWLRLSELQFDASLCTGIAQELFNVLLQLTTTETVQKSIDGDITVLSITTPTYSIKEASVSYKPNNNVNDNKEVFRTAQTIRNSDFDGTCSGWTTNCRVRHNAKAGKKLSLWAIIIFCRLTGICVWLWAGTILDPFCAHRWDNSKSLS